LIVGIDFDNTIVCYDNLFHKVALEKGLIPNTLSKNKLAIRNFMREAGIEQQWTEMQGYVYGARMIEAHPYEGVLDFIDSLINNGHSVRIISHKTQFPFIGPKYDLRKAARAWIEKYINHDGQILVGDDLIYFESTKKEKIFRINTISPDFYVDDLPEILLDEDFSNSVKRILFSPKENLDFSGIALSSWKDISDYIHGFS